MNSQNLKPEQPALTDGTALVGHFFHSFSAGKIVWQGFILACPMPGWYLVELFSWLTGSPNGRRLVRFEDLTGWRFYTDALSMAAAFEREAAKESAGECDA